MIDLLLWLLQCLVHRRWLQAAAAAALQSIVTRFQQAAEVASDSRPGTDLSKIDEEIVRHMPVLHRAISQPDTVKAQTINTGMHVAQLLRDKYEAEKHLSTGQVCSVRHPLAPPSTHTLHAAGRGSSGACHR